MPANRVRQLMRAILRICLIVLALTALAAAARPPKTWSDGYDFAAVELRSEQETSRATLTQGKALVLLAWSPDCPHCLTHMPYAAALVKKLDADQARFVTACLGGDADDALKYLKRKELDWPVLDGTHGEFAEGYYDAGWPVTYVFAPGGELAGTCETQGPSYIDEVLDLVNAALK